MSLMVDKLWFRDVLAACGITALAAVAGAAALSTRHFLMMSQENKKSESMQEETQDEKLSPDLAEWLRDNGLSLYSSAFCWQGYNDLALLCDLSDAETEEMILELKIRSGHAARLRRLLRALRDTKAQIITSQMQEVVETGFAPQQGDESHHGHDAQQIGVTEQNSSKSADANMITTSPPSAPANQISSSINTEIDNTGASSSSSAQVSARSLLTFTIGSRVQLQGLARRAELNGSIGRLIARDESCGRWELALEGGKGTIRVRSENLMWPNSNEVPADAETEPEIPEDFRCCITRELMEQPVITSDGHTYERSAIAQWLQEHGTSPKTGQQLPDKVLRPNHAMRAQIIAFRERSGMQPLPPWEPAPQETVPTRHATNHEAGTIQLPTVTLHTPAGNVALPLAMVQGQAQGIPVDLVALLRSQQGLRDELIAAAQGNFGGESPSEEVLAATVAADPRLGEHMVRWLQQNPVALQPGIHGQLRDNVMNESPLFRAARQGEFSVLERLLGDRSGQQLHQEINFNGDTLLHVASWFGQVRVVTMLIARGHAVLIPSRNRSAPLHYASFHGHAEVVRVLIEARADTEQRMLGGDTPLHQASWQGHLEVIKLLIEKGACLSAVKDDGDSPLALASFRGHIGVCQELVDCMASSSSASNWQSWKNQHGFSVLHVAAAGGQTDSVKFLLEQRANADTRSNNEDTPLHRAVSAGKKDMAEFLLASQADPEAVRLDDDHTPLQVAVLEGYSHLVKTLIEHRASVERPRRDGMSPLHLAVLRLASAPVRAGEGSVMEALAEARANPEVRARSNFTPLQLCLSQLLSNAPHRITALRSILEIRADVHASTREGDLPLHIAVLNNLRAEAIMLLERRADLNLQRPDGCTALHLAAQNGVASSVEFLLSSRADPTLRNAVGRTAHEVARQNGFEQVEQILRRSMPSSES